MPVYQPNLPGGGSPPTELYCTLNEFLNSYNSTTNSFTCGAVSGSGGENNTASNIGSGLGWYKQKVGVDLQFNSVLAGQGIDITDTTNDLTISTDFLIDSVDCGTDFVQEINNVTGAITCAAGSGEVNTYSSSGHGAGVIILTKSGVDLPFRGIAAGSGATVTQNGTDVIISAAGLSDGDKGDITVSGSGATWTIDNNVVTYAKMQDISATSRFLGRITGGSGDTEELTGTQATTLLDAFTSVLKGLVPASGGGTSNFLRADGTWAAPTASGGATSLGADVTCTATASYCTVFTILLTSSSGNTIDGLLSADSNTAGAAVQVRGRADDAQALGWCNFITPLTATTQAIDNFVVSTNPTDTGETVWLPAANTPQTIQFRCTVEADSSSPQNLIIEIQQEVASTGTVQKGSHYIKTP